MASYSCLRRYGAIDGGNGGGIFRQAAGDNRWEHLTNGLPEDADVHAITVHPENPDVGLCRQHEGRLSQHQSRQPGRSYGFPSEADIWSVCIHPKNPRVVYAGATPAGRLSQR